MNLDIIQIMKSFVVRKIVIVTDNNSSTLGLAEKSDGTGRQIIFQKAGSYNRRDKALNMNTYSISDQKGATVYGGVEKFNLENNQLHISLNEEASEAFGVTELTLTLQTDKDSIRDLQLKLNDVLR